MRSVKPIIRALSAVNVKLAVLFRWLAATFLALMTFFIVLQVVCRYGFNASLFWPEDVSMMMMIWVAFAVAPIAYRNGSNVALDTFVRFLRGRASFVLYLLIHVLVLAMLVVLITESLEMIGRSQIRANSIPVPMKYIYMIMPIGFGAMVLVALELMLRCLLGLMHPRDEAARLPTQSQPDVQRG